jgi:PKHD-type hydroxylase
VLLIIRQALNGAQLHELRQALAGIDWIDGRATAGHLSTLVKHNDQVDEEHPVGLRCGAVILDTLEKNPTFMSGALPASIVPPLFNRYSAGQSYGRHIDGGIRPVAGTHHRVRTDLAATLFLSDPEEYDGGELIMEDTFGIQQLKLPAGDLVVYPANSIHEVTPVTRGTRIASFFWIQSLVREDRRRRMLFGLDTTIQSLRRESPDSDSILELTALYHNLLREWAEL